MKRTQRATDERTASVVVRLTPRELKAFQQIQMAWDRPQAETLRELIRAEAARAGFPVADLRKASGNTRGVGG